jgi:hypothetical protein
MSEILKNEHGREGFETEDLSPAGVFYFMAGLAVVGVLIYFIVVGMYRFLDAYDRSHQAPVNPMAVETGVDPRTMKTHEIREQLNQTFPRPVLESSELTQFGDYLGRQDAILGSYDWVDQRNGVVRIPIERAMDLLAARGLPVLPQGEAAVNQEAKAKPATRGAGPKD